MKTQLLFDLPERDHVSTRQERKSYVAEMKAKHGIQTHLCWGSGDWMALCMPEAVKLLDGYGLTQEEKTSLPEIMAGYCRLLDESGIISDHHKTEYEAVRATVERISL